MARIRQIKPEFFLDDELAQCAIGARLMFAGLWGLADRKGRLEDRPAKIRAQLFPYDPDISTETVGTFLEQLASKKFIIRYSLANRQYIQIRTFHIHQRCHPREAKSQIPAPPEFIESDSEDTDSSPEKDMPSREKDAPRCPASTSTSGGWVWEGERLTPIGDIPRAEFENPGPPPRPIPPVFEITEKLKAWSAENVPDINLEAELRNFQVYCRAKGKRYADWEAGFQSWLLKAPGFNHSAGSRSPPRESREKHNRRVIAEAWAKLEQQGRSP